MFNSKSKTTELPISSATIIGGGTTINGDIESSGDIRIDGTLIGTDGVVEGNIIGQQADVLGCVTGHIKIKELLQLRGKCNVSGEIHAGKLEVEPSATFNGSCHMGANVVELNADMGLVASK